MVEGIRNQVVFALVVVVTVTPTWAIRPEKPLTSIHSLDTRNIIAPSPRPGGYLDVALHPPIEYGEQNAALEKSRGPWQRFTASTGQRWLVRWNPVTGTPHLVVGRPLALPGVQKLTSQNIEAACLGFAAANADLLRAEPKQMKLAKKERAGGRWFVSYRQIHGGVPVLGGQLNMSFAKDDRLIMFGSDVYPDVSVETEPNIGQKEAMRLAQTDCEEGTGDDRISEAELCILPLRRPESFDYLLCWKLYVYQPTIQKKWEYLIDANTGQTISKSNALIYGSVGGTARGEYKPEFASDPNEMAAFPYEEVSARGPEIVIAAWDFDTDPMWTAEGEWAFGTPTGGGGYCTDPNSGYTGSNVYGYNLHGDYQNSMPAYYLTTTPIDCSSYENVHLSFMRWLSVESSWWDDASVEVSNDGNDWTVVWSNPPGLLCEGEWVRVLYDISAVADLQPTVYVRWAMGPTDYTVTYAGWNIDDVKVVSYVGGVSTTQTQVDGSYNLMLNGNRFTIASELEGLYCDIDYACGLDALFEEPNVYAPNVVDFTWDSDWYNELVEPSVYWHVNYVHDYYSAMDAALSESSTNFPLGLDYPMRVAVQVGWPYGYCNAYWDGEGMAFGASDEWFCDNFGLYSEVIYHEYTHAVTSRIYDGIELPYVMESGALNEAWSDYFGCVLSPSQSALVGDGGLLLDYPDGFRTLDNTYRRETDFSNGVHFDSQMVSGALWEVRQVIDGQVGAEQWDQMVHFARYAHPQAFEEYVLAVLVEDDIRYGDGYLDNGSPHGEAIHAGFGNHGIGGLQYLAPSVVIDDAGGNGNGKLDPGETVNLSLSLTNGWANATRVSARLSSADPFVGIKKSKADFPDVNYGGITQNSTEPFVVSLDPTCPETYTIRFTLEITAAGPYSYTRTCFITYAVAVNQLAYDDGQIDIYIGYNAPGGALAVRITPQMYPCYPTHVRFFPYQDADSPIDVTVTVWDDDGPNSLPGTVLGSIQTGLEPVGDWFDVDISSLGLSIDDGSFYVGWVGFGGSARYYNGLDMDPPYYGRSWVYLLGGDGGLWVPFEGVGFLANLMVRVRYFYTTAGGPVENLTTGRRYDYIEHAIYDAVDGDEIVASEGVYYENINFRGKNVTVRSADPGDPAVRTSTVINGGNRGPVVTFSSGEDESCTLSGFTITGGGKEEGKDNKGGIYCFGLNETGPTISYCIVSGNAGPGIYSNNSSPTIKNCTVVENEDCGIELKSGGCPRIINCIVARNMRDGILGGNPKISNCTIVNNAQSGIAQSGAVITNCIISDNSDSEITGTAVATYSNIKGGWAGLGNIDVDPCFVDPNDDDYHLRSKGGRWNSAVRQWTWDAETSRCVDAGNPGLSLGDEPLTVPGDPNNDLGENLRINMGAYGGTVQASMPPYDWALLADLTNNGVVDFEDFSHQADDWLQTQIEQPGDLDRNGTIDYADLQLLAEDWLKQTTWH
jgi:parallel beta-helix repeat protein